MLHILYNIIFLDLSMVFDVICVTPKSCNVTVTCDIILTPNSKIKDKVKVKYKRKKNRKQKNRVHHLQFWQY